MPAKPPKSFDVWLVAANTVYKAVPYQVVADWTQQGRLSEADRLRPAGAADAWKPVAEWELLADYLPHPAAAAVAREAVTHEPVELSGADEGIRTRRRADEDDDVDMIPLIDISMVLLVFFIMIQAAGALAPVDVPEMKYAGQLTAISMVLLVFFIIVSATGALSPVDVPDMKYGGELVESADAITINIEKASETDVRYAVRVGKMAPEAKYASLPNDVEALKALDEILANYTKPPEVRIACEKDLPSARVSELAFELKKRFEARKINSFVATVNEAQKKQ
jgi:biopolymer transport protein ExbD